jgi:hypothetical protein
MAKKGFQKGSEWVGNANGRPPRPEIAQLRKALEKVAKDQDSDLLEHFVKRAYKNDRVLVALAKKIIPDLSAITGDYNIKIDRLSELIAEIRKNRDGLPDGKGS